MNEICLTLIEGDSGGSLAKFQLLAQSSVSAKQPQHSNSPSV